MVLNARCYLTKRDVCRERDELLFFLALSRLTLMLIFVKRALVLPRQWANMSADYIYDLYFFIVLQPKTTQLQH